MDSRYSLPAKKNCEHMAALVTQFVGFSCLAVHDFHVFSFAKFRQASVDELKFIMQPCLVYKLIIIICRPTVHGEWAPNSTVMSCIIFLLIPEWQRYLSKFWTNIFSHLQHKSIIIWRRSVVHQTCHVLCCVFIVQNISVTLLSETPERKIASRRPYHIDAWTLNNTLRQTNPAM